MSSWILVCSLKSFYFKHFKCSFVHLLTRRTGGTEARDWGHPGVGTSSESPQTIVRIMFILWEVRGKNCSVITRYSKLPKQPRPWVGAMLLLILNDENLILNNLTWWNVSWISSLVTLFRIFSISCLLWVSWAGEREVSELKYEVNLSPIWGFNCWVSTNNFTSSVWAAQAAQAEGWDQFLLSRDHQRRDLSRPRIK